MKNDVKLIDSNGLAAYNAVPSLHIFLVLHLETRIVSRYGLLSNFTSIVLEYFGS
jgi:hypothetical protein